MRAIATLLALPLLGTTTFAALFASANPLIAEAFGAISLPSAWRVAIWIGAAVAVWPSLRPRALVTHIVARMPGAELRLPGATLPSVLLALGLFNAVFAIPERGWTWRSCGAGRRCRQGMTTAAYVHRGAYPLIVTALLAGFLVLAMLRPGSASAASVLARRLVVLWVAQNLVLVASSALRTIDYIAVSMLTAWRIAALIWMALRRARACADLLADAGPRGRHGGSSMQTRSPSSSRSPRAASSMSMPPPPRGTSSHAREAGGGPAPLDLCYLARMGSSALVPLARLERRRLPAGFRDRLRFVRQEALAATIARQTDWHSWTWARCAATGAGGCAARHAGAAPADSERCLAPLRRDDRASCRAAGERRAGVYRQPHR